MHFLRTRTFTYRWRYLPTGQSGVNIVNQTVDGAPLSEVEFLRLLNTWNRRAPETWHYWSEDV